MRPFLLSLFLLSLSTPTQALSNEEAQDSLPSWRIGTRAHYGFIMPHRRGMRHLVKDHIRSFSLSLERPTTGEKAWQQEYLCPSWGLNLIYSDLGNPEMLGKAMALFPYLDFPLIKGEKSGLYFRTGTGIGWIEKPFDRLENHKNIAIGSQGNVTFNFMLHGKWRLPGRWELSGGLAFDHFSNMAVRVPNLGINLPNAHIGIAKGIGKKRGSENARSSSAQDEEDPATDPWRFSLIGGGGMKGISPPDGKLFPALSLMGLASKRVSDKSALGIGPDLEWNSTLRRVISEDGSDGEELPSHYELRVGIKAAYTLVIERLRLIGQWGYYLKNEHEEEGPFYHRFGVRYDLDQGWVLNGTLRTHFAKADHFELGFGYRFGGD